MKFYLKHILTRDNNKYTRLSGYNPLHRDFPRSSFDFYKRKERKDFKGSFPDYTLPTFTTYKLLKSTWGNFFVYKLKEQMQSNLKKKLNEITKQRIE